MAKKIHLDIDKLKELVDKGLTQKEIALNLGVGKTTIYKTLKENNIKMKNAYKPLDGQIFTKLTVIKQIGRDYLGWLYLCKCECGNEVVARSQALTLSQKKSCGCYKNRDTQKRNHYNNAISKIGEKHHRLSIIDVEYIQNKGYLMVCKCECDNIVKAIHSNLVRGSYKSCGCYQREIASKNATLYGINNKYYDRDWYFIKNNSTISCRSGYEVLYANYLMINNIDFEYESKTFLLSNNRRYTPDFYLTKEDRYIEIKGKYEKIFHSGNQDLKRELFSKDYKLETIYWDDIASICNLPYKSYQHYRYISDRLNIRVEDYLGKMIYLTY